MIRDVVKIFDPRDPATAAAGSELLDASVVRRDNRWWMYLAGQAGGHGATDIFSASLPPGAPLASSGWMPTRGSDGQLMPLASNEASRAWDGDGGRHCPSYVRGWDPHRGAWVERIYYAGSAAELWGPYAIGFLEWDGERWADQAEPVFRATAEWEHGSVYEPNLVYDEGRWKLWYVAGSNSEDYLVHGYSESVDGRTSWSDPVVFAPADMKMFDFCVRERVGGFDAIYSRVCVAVGVVPADAGLWHCRSSRASGRLADWGRPTQVMTAEDRGWHSGPWKPSFAVDDQADGAAFVFFDGLYRTDDPGPFPFAFTLGAGRLHLAAA